MAWDPPARDAENLSLFPEQRNLNGRSSSGSDPPPTTGVLPSQLLERCIQDGCISANPAISEDQVQPASLDLRLGSVAYRVQASFLPGARTVEEKVRDFKTHELDLSSPCVLERGCIYIVPLMERVWLPADMSGKANPKSSIGRLDVFTRLITDYGTEFERVPPGYRGQLFVEVVPRTFSVAVRAGSKMNQLRLVRGKPPPSDALLTALHEREALVYRDDDSPEQPLISKGLWISVDLEGDGPGGIVGYRAKPNAPLIELDRIGHYDPSDFWEPIERPRRKSLILNPEDFYILSSAERVRVPPESAAEMVGYDPSVGEVRIHYAGFFDPGFGHDVTGARGTKAVLEVRSHEVPFVLENRQRVGRLVYERLLAPAHRLYGREIGSSYQGQSLSLSKHFRMAGRQLASP